MKTLFLFSLAFGILVISSCAQGLGGTKSRYLPYAFKIYSMDGGSIEGRYGRGEIRAAGLDGEKFTGSYSTIETPQPNSRYKDLKGKSFLQGDKGTVIQCSYTGVWYGGYNDSGFGECQTNRGQKMNLQF